MTATPAARPLQPPAVLLMGPAGCGKTTALTTLIAAGVELFVLITEPNGAESLLDACERQKLPVDRLHWHSVAPVAAGWSALTQMVTTVNAMSYKDITEMKMGISKSEQKAFFDILKTVQNFHDDRTGLDYGDVTEWGPERAFAIDSLSGLSLIAMANTVGLKPAIHQGEWGVAMNVLEQLILKITSDSKCFFVLTAHVEKESDELTGGNKTMVSTLGRKLAPKIPRFFSEVVLAKKDLSGFTWATSSNDADLKNRALISGDKLPPTFVPIVDAFKRRLLAVNRSEGATTPPSMKTPSSPVS